MSPLAHAVLPAAARDGAAPIAGSRRGRLFRRYFLFIMALVCGALLASGGISLYAAYEENKAALARLQKEKAISAAARIEQFIKGIEQQLSFAALPQLGSEGAEQRRIEFLKLLRQAPAVTDISQLDGRGQEVLAVSRLSMDSAGGSKDRAADPAFLNAKPGKPWIGPVYFRKETEPYFSVGLRSGGAAGGVTVAEVNLKFVWDVVSRIRVGEKGKAYVVDARGQLVADPDIGLVLRKTDLASLTQVKAALGGKGEDEPALIARAQGGAEVLTAWSPIETLGWQVFVEQPVSEVYATLNASIVRTGLLLLVGLVVSAIVSTFLARSMVRPIRVLQEGAQRIGEGELEQRIEVKTNDELETLAEQFNQMTAQLRESYSGLERKVDERTGELTESLQYQTAISEVLRVISESPTDVAPVFRTILDCTRRLFDNPMTAVMLYDGEKVDLVATGNWPEDALEDSKRFYPAPPNPKMLSGRVILGGKVLSIEDTLADSGYDQTTAATGHWRRMLGAPMVKDGATVGVIVVAWPDPGETPQRQADLLKTFADQAVIAIENVRLINETKTALERQTTTAEILRVISQSMDDAKPVFQAIAERTSKLFGGEQIGLLLVEGDQLVLAGSAGSQSWDLEHQSDLVRQFFPKPLNRETSSGVAILERRVVEINDTESPEVIAAMPNLIPLMRACGYRSELCVPMMRGGEAIGTISVNRTEPGSFKAGEIELLRTFADQAVIAIENARLFNETRTALERQTATAEILRVISSSPTDTQPVFAAIVETCQRLFRGRAVAFCVPREGMLETVAFADDGTAQVRDARGFLAPWPLDRGSAAGASLLDARLVHVGDTEQAVSEFPRMGDLAIALGYRAGLFVPVMQKGRAIACLAILHPKAGRFAEDQIALARTFADQAVIAIENVRLFEEVQARTRELEESLEYQTATSDVLKAISRTTFDLTAVMDSLVATSLRLCRADGASYFRFDGEVFRWENGVGLESDYEKIERETLIALDRGTLVGRAGMERRLVHILDALADPEYAVKDEAAVGKVRTMLGVPLLRGGKLLGVFALARNRVEAFTERQIDLVTMFADQAVIAMENVRLLTETQEALDRQTATAEILRVISSSPTDVQPVFQAIAAASARLIGTDSRASVWMAHDGQYHPAAFSHPDDASDEVAAQYPRPIDPNGMIGAMLLDARPRQVTDVFASDFELAKQVARTRGWRAWLGTPLMREGVAVGVIGVVRERAGPFSASQVALLQTFADQAVIAMENVRLFNEIEEKSRQLEMANQHKSEFLANMSHELRTPLNAVIGFSEVLIEGMFGEMNEKQLDYVQDIHASGKHLLSLINDILDLSKIEAGRMELEVSTFNLPAAVGNAVTLVRERAQRHGIELVTTVNESLGDYAGDERKFKQIMLNLLSNAVKFTGDGGRVTVAAGFGAEGIEVSVADTGIGIAQEDQPRVFEEFVQVGSNYATKREGTGLGLPLARRFVELHGGRMWLESVPGEGSTFHFVLPVKQGVTA